MSVGFNFLVNRIVVFMSVTATLGAEQAIKLTSKRYDCVIMIN